jgi:hypothetical protein
MSELRIRHDLAGCGKTRAVGESRPQALKRGHILDDLTARLNVVPFPNPLESKFFPRPVQPCHHATHIHLTRFALAPSTGGMGGGYVLQQVGGLPVGAVIPLENLSIGRDDCSAEGMGDQSAFFFVSQSEVVGEFL